MITYFSPATDAHGAPGRAASARRVEDYVGEPRDSASGEPVPRPGGAFRFGRRVLYLASAMVDQHLGLEETDDGRWAIHFNTVLLATLDDRDYIIQE